MKNKKHIFTFLLLMCCITMMEAQEFKNVDKSPHDIAYYRTNKITSPLVKVLYGRPQKNGREIFGKLVPYNEVWRLGANEATEITFFNDVIFGDKKVKKGTYTMYAIPNKTEWTVILSSNIDVWGSNAYNKKDDVVRVKAEVKKAEDLESFSIGFKKKNDVVNMIFGWDTTRVLTPLKFIE